MTNRVITVSAFLLVVTLPLFAASDIFLKVDGVPGESKAPGHEGWIEISSFSFGVTQPTSVGSATTTGSKTPVHDLSFTHVVDKASPILMNAALTGQHFPNVTIDLHGQRYLLKDVVVSSFQQAHSPTASNVVLLETVKMHYAQDATHESTITMRKAGKGQQEFLIFKQSNNAMFTGGLAGQATVQSLTISGNNSAIIAVCDPTGTNGILIGLRQASVARQKMPELGVVIQGGTQPAEQKKQKADTQQFMQYSFKNATITGFTPMAGGCTQVGLNFSSYTGPTTHFDYLK
ncbi:MAG TPA: type VI secretion system tube protein Hcp [Thermoanaerobaculia bacterium]